MARDISMPVSLDDVIVPEGRRELNGAAVAKLASSIEEIGLRHPITVRKERGGDRYVLVAGLHRLEACRKLGREHVPAIIVSMTNDEARMWEIAENLHRAELTKLERAEQIEEWRELKAKGAQVGHPSNAQPHDRGIVKTAEDLGVSRAEVGRAEAIASIEPAAKQAAADAGLADNASALLKVASAPPAQQAAVVKALADTKPARGKATRVDADVKDRAARAVAEVMAEHVPGAAWDNLKANLYAAGAANIANELTNITGEAVMDRRYG